jgi:hypothetical protein
MFLIFTALTLLFVFVISKVSANALQGEVRRGLTGGLTNTLVDTNRATGGLLKAQLSRWDTSLAVLDSLTKGPDSTSDMYNQSLYTYSYLIIGIFFVALIVMLLVMAYGANVKIKPLVMRVLYSNLIIFAVVGVFEFIFFQQTARKFIPITPSYITQTLLESMKTI